MGEEFIKYLIGYTISEDALRDTLREELKRKFGEDLSVVNESMYELKKGGDISSTVKTLKEAVEGSREETGCEFKEGDFVRLYYAARMADYTDLARRDLMIEQAIL